MNYYGKKSEKHGIGSSLLGYFVGAGIGLICFAVLMCAFALMLSLTDISDGVIPLFAGISVAVASICGGLFTGKLTGTNGIRTGLITGGVYVLIHLICCLVFTGTLPSGFPIIYIGIELIGSIIGGIFGVNLSK